MENKLYDEIVSIIETEVKRITTFLREQIKDHEIPEPNTEVILKHIKELQKKMTPTLEKNMEGLLHSLILPNWKTMFEIDNFIDTNKTLEEQKIIIADYVITGDLEKAIRESTSLGKEYDEGNIEQDDIYDYIECYSNED
jgi:hypothetical protein